MNRLKFGDIVLIKFPYTDGKSLKRRPALIINDFNDGDIIVCRITSQIHNTKNDINIVEWRKTGLKLPSVIRVHKIATLGKAMVESVMGCIDTLTKDNVRIVMSELTN